MKTIKDMPEHSRPREKLLEKGPSALADEELVAAILGRGMVDIGTEAGKILGRCIFDHIIVTSKGYFSFQEAGLIET